MLSHAPKTLKSVLEKLNNGWTTLNLLQEKPYKVYEFIPEEFEQLLQQTISKITDYLAEHPTYNETKLLSFYFLISHWLLSLYQ